MLRMAVCDKEEETCSLIKALAEESIGCKVWTFHSDTELLESKEKYDILLLDIGNGEPTGIETARKIRRCYDPILIFIAEQIFCSLPQCSCNTKSLKFSPGKFLRKTVFPVFFDPKSFDQLF